MNRTKFIFITAFAMFSMFFGAGNLILPPYLGYQAGSEWLLVSLGFALSAVLLPLLGVFAHSKLQGTILYFFGKMPAWIGMVYGVLVYSICIILPCPRTASVTFELSVLPFFEMPSWIFSAIYFGLALVVILNRSKILDIIGEYLTPGILLIMLLIIGVSLFYEPSVSPVTMMQHPVTGGILEGYQTFDAIASIVVGGVIVTSLHLNKDLDYQQKRKTIFYSGVISGIALFLIYTGLIYASASYQSEFTTEPTRVQVLSQLSDLTLGRMGVYMLSLLVGLACFSTAVGIIVGTADFFKDLCGGSQKVYTAVAIISCVVGVFVGQMNVNFIINIALPILILIYPLTIVLIILNNLSDKWANPLTFRGTILAVFLLSIPDFLASINVELGRQMVAMMPLGEYSLGWLLPTLFVYALLLGLSQFRK